MVKKTWRRGRSGICQEGKSVTTSIQLCPDVKEKLKDFCKRSGILKSVVINAAVLAYIKNNEGEK